MDNNSKEEIVVKDLTEESVSDDLSIIPLSKDCFAVCELCGRVGRRGQFNPRQNRYCSRYCHQSFKSRKNVNWKFQIMESTDHMEGMIPLEPLPQLHSWHASFSDLQAGPLKHNANAIANSYEWKDELFRCDFLAAPVSLFKHAPLSDMWDSTFESMKVEVKNTDCDNCSEKLGDYFWVASVLKVKGYMGLLRYEGFGSDSSKDFWVNLCCSDVHPVGWCATRGKPLIPPKTIEEKYSDWKKFLVKQLTGARTLPANFYSKLHESSKSRFSIGTIMEVVDKNRISQVKVASVHEIVGKRLHVKYYDSSPEDNGFWCHEDSPLIHPVGWAFRVGHPLDGNQSYCSRVAAGRYLPCDATPDLFKTYSDDEKPLFRAGQKIEAIDPLNLSSICAATVMQTLRQGFMMVRIDCYEPAADGADWFCYHQRSPCIFPAGFAAAHDIPLKPPHGYLPETFTWEEYLLQTGARAAPLTLFHARGHLVLHGFVANMKLECADLMDPRLVCVATISRVVADMLKIHFDGWGSEYDQWLWAHSTDVYPVGWARAAGHRLEGPPPPPPRRALRTNNTSKTNKRRRRGAPLVRQPPTTTEESSLNSEPGDKSMSPFASASEMSADVDTRHSTYSEKTSDSHQTERVEESPPQQVPEAQSDSSELPPNSVEPKSNSPEPDPSAAEPTPNTPEPTNGDPPSPKRSKTESDKVIPRLVNTSVPQEVLNSVDVKKWTPSDVARFLTVNDCQPYCEYFTEITGPKLLQLTKDEIIELLKMKVGPSLKIFDLVQQLRCKIKQPHRLLGNFK